MNKKILALFGVLALGVGVASAVALQSHAQNASGQSATNTSVVSSGDTAASGVDTPDSANDPADTDTGSKTHGHAPLGGDGVITSITGTTIVFGEESNEGGTSYTVDASKATVTNNGASASLSDIKVGDKVFVQGAVNGTSVSATSISLGHPNWGGKKEANDNDGGKASETNEGTSGSDASDQ